MLTAAIARLRDALPRGRLIRRAALLLALTFGSLLTVAEAQSSFTPDPAPPPATLQFMDQFFGEYACSYVIGLTPPTLTIAPGQTIKVSWCGGNGYPYANPCTYTYTYGGAVLYSGLPLGGGTIIPGAIATSPQQTQFAVAPGQFMTVPVSLTLTPAKLPPKAPPIPGVYGGTAVSYYLEFWGNFAAPYCLGGGPAYDGPDVFNYYPVNVVAFDISLIDPIADNLASGSGIVSDPAQLVAATHVVQGAAADGATQVLVRIAGVQVGQSVQLTVQDESGPSEDPASAGYLTDLPPSGADSRTGGGTITVTALDTGDGTATAFAIYHAPTDFVRDGNGLDAQSKLRTVTLIATDPSSGHQTNQPISIVRPPVALVHGLWGHPSDFDGADGGVLGLLQSQSLFAAYPLRFDGYFSVSSTVPSFTPSPIAVSGNTLGFEYGASTILPGLENVISGYKAIALSFAQAPSTGAIAAVQADIVGHSMGGNVTRTLPLMAGYADQKTYNQGYVHKLISIDTPHQGSALATMFLASSNTCLRNALGTLKGLYAFNYATPSGNSAQSGAINDLQPGSAAILATQKPNSTPVPTAMIGGSMTYEQLSTVGEKFGPIALDRLCDNFFVTDPLAAALTPMDWPIGLPSDAIVTLASQFDGQTAYSSKANTFPGVHSGGAEALGFGAPTILDQASGGPAAVIKLLNTPVSDTAVYEAKP